MIAAVLHVANVLTCAEANVGAFAACGIAATIPLLHERGWRSSWGLPRQARDQRLSLAAYVFIYFTVQNFLRLELQESYPRIVEMLGKRCFCPTEAEIHEA